VSGFGGPAIDAHEADQPSDRHGDPDGLRTPNVFAEQEQRPQDRQSRLHDLGDSNRADLDGPLSEHHEAVRGDARQQCQHQGVAPAPSGHREYAAVRYCQRQNHQRGDRADRRHECGDVEVTSSLAGGHDIGDQQSHRHGPVDVPSRRGVTICWTGDQHESDTSERYKGEPQRSWIVPLIKQPRSQRDN
jgi:hypothetical protein